MNHSFIHIEFSLYSVSLSLQILKGDGHLTITANGRIVQIKQTQVSDTGRYTCVATNIAGEDEKDFDVNIQGERVLPFQNPELNSLHAHYHPNVFIYTLYHSKVLGPFLKEGCVGTYNKTKSWEGPILRSMSPPSGCFIY